MVENPSATAAAPEATQQRGVYRIALSMSGAISAGAYTAGVFDFLIQALTELELAKQNVDPADLPKHDVRIVALTGASAGGITAALGTVALGYGMTFEPVTQTGMPRQLRLHRVKNSERSPIDCVLPRLYDTWVVRPRMFGPSPDDPALLSVEDVAEGKVQSLLNCRVLNQIRDAALARPPAAEQGPPYAFFAEPTHVYLTISNLRGVPYDVKGMSEADAYHMLSHGDRLHFAISGLGTDIGAASNWAGRDQAIRMTVKELRDEPGLPNSWSVLGDAALATAAFPGGLSARLLKATREDFKNRWFPAPRFNGASIEPTWPSGFAPTPIEFGFINVDGGMINNDPFEYARYALLDNWEDAEARNARGADAADRAVIMISPFPEGSQFDPEDRLDSGLVSVAKLLLPTLISQARCKLTELAAAADASIASRWLIAPRRSEDIKETPSSANIACGLLGGFGGFLDQRFREHDFQLGRRNCQKFLLDHSASAFTTRDQRVVPLFGSAKTEVPPPEWQRISMQDFETLMTRIELRANAVVPALIKQETGSYLVRMVGNIAWSGLPFWDGIRQRVLKTVRGIVLADLIARDQIEDGLRATDPQDDRLLRNFQPDERRVIAAMADARYDLRTIPGICASTRLDCALVKKAIDKAEALDGDVVHRVWRSRILTKDGEPTYTLYSRRLGPTDWPVVGSLARRVSSVSIDWPPPAAAPP